MGCRRAPSGSRPRFYKAAEDRRASAERDTAAVRRQGFVFGSGCLVVTVAALASATLVYIRTPLPQPPGYILVHDTIGQVDPPTAAKDAPRLFGESVRRKAIRDYIMACESYVPATWAKLDYHNCMVMNAPAEQKRREADIGKGGPRYPVALFGPQGSAVPIAFTAWTPLGVTDGTYHYQVRYERAETASGYENRVRWTADIVFSFHPELKISSADALVNNTGFQGMIFSTTKDSLQ